MFLKNLSDAIILQAIEDLWDERRYVECMSFFKGEGFGVCARLSALSPNEQIRLKLMINKLIRYEYKTGRVKKFRAA